MRVHVCVTITHISLNFTVTFVCACDHYITAAFAAEAFSHLVTFASTMPVVASTQCFSIVLLWGSMFSMIGVARSTSSGQTKAKAAPKKADSKLKEDDDKTVTRNEQALYLTTMKNKEKQNKLTPEESAHWAAYKADFPEAKKVLIVEWKKIRLVEWFSS